MDSLKIGFFYDSGKRDHVCTLLGLEDAYRRQRSTSSSFRADGKAGALDANAALDSVDNFTIFDAISLEPEFSSHPVLRHSLFLFDSAIDFDDCDWQGGELDEIGHLSRVAALDIRAWSIFSVLFNRDIPLLPAPLAPSSAGAKHQERRIAIVVNDAALALRALDEIREAIRRVEPEMAIIELRNPYRSPMRQSDWLRESLADANAHIHIGFPLDAASFGRLIDTMNMRAPCIVFDAGQNTNDADIKTLWRRPAYEHNVNFVRIASIKALTESLHALVRDRSWAQHLIGNALREVILFQEQVQNSLLPNKFADVYLTVAS